jgi:hypothetical protein
VDVCERDKVRINVDVRERERESENEFEYIYLTQTLLLLIMYYYYRCCCCCCCLFIHPIIHECVRRVRSLHEIFYTVVVDSTHTHIMYVRERFNVSGLRERERERGGI